MQIRTAGFGLLVGGLIAAGGSFADRLKEMADDQQVLDTTIGKAGLACAVVVVLAGIALVAGVNPPRLIAFVGLLLGAADFVLGIIGYVDARGVDQNEAAGGPLLVALGGLMAVTIGVLSLRPPPST